jgi:hypothetical protein
MHRRTLLAATAGLPGFAAAQPAPRAHWPRAMTMATGAAGATFALYGAAWAQMAQEATGINISTRSSQGGVQNTILVDSGQAELGMVAMGVALQGWNGTAEWTQGRQFRNVRAIFPMYASPFQFMTTPRAGIRGVADLNGKVVGVGPRGGFPGTYIPMLLDALGVRPRDIRHANFADLGGQMADGLIDAVGTSSGVPFQPFVEFETSRPAVTFGFTADEVARLVARFPELSPATVPANTYRTQPEPQTTVTVWNFAIAHRALPDDLVRTIVAFVMDNNARLVAGHASGRETLPENAPNNSFMTWHPGAAAYFRERGIALPAETLAGA